MPQINAHYEVNLGRTNVRTFRRISNDAVVSKAHEPPLNLKGLAATEDLKGLTLRLDPELGCTKRL